MATARPPGTIPWIIDSILHLLSTVSANEGGGGRSRIEHAPCFGYVLTVRRANCQRAPGSNCTPRYCLASEETDHR